MEERRTDEALSSAPLGAEHPRQIGPYRILRVLGAGGIGIVYLAEQSEPVRRRVALKVIKVGMDTHQVVARFASERQALAVMDHPNIAHVLDAGAGDNGRPYFVMEYVRGVPITDYCDTQRLSTQERVGLFLEVCAATQHAHQKGVVHRDLKPSNIMVGVQDGKPQVKVIDFGIAKAMGQGLTDRTLVTRVGQLLGTPAYMSPEQAEMSGVDVDTRTDIYSLGVVLYELLSGALPMELGSVPEHALRHALRDTDVPTPSARLTTLGDAGDAIARHRRTDVKRLRRELQGDLDWIVAKALEKDRTRRYETVESFAADLRRHLEHVPVLARPRSARYVFGRFLARHKAGVAAAAVAVVALVAGAALATAGFIRATRAEHEARQQAQTAQRTSQFLVDLFEVSDPSEARGNTVTAREILDRGAERVRTELTDEPETQTALMHTIGVVYRKLGLYAEAQALLEQSLAIRRATFGDESPQLLEGLVGLGEVHYQQGDQKTAEPMLRHALALAERLHLPGNVAIAEAMSDLGVVLASTERHEYAAAAELHRKALAIYLRERGPDSREAALVRGNLAAALLRLRDVDEAVALMREAIAADVRLLAADDPQTAIHQVGLAEMLAAGPRRAESERVFRSALATMRKTLGEEHQRVANTYRNLGLLLLFDPARYAEAEALFRDALRVYAVVHPEGHGRVARVRSDLGLVLMLLGRHAEAERELVEAATLLDRLGGPARDQGLIQARLADLLVSVGRYEDALAAATRARAESSEEDAVRRVYATSGYAAAVAGLGRTAEAEALSAQLRPPPGRPLVLDRLAIMRVLVLYARWASPQAVAALVADLDARGYGAAVEPVPDAP